MDGKQHDDAVEGQWIEKAALFACVSAYLFLFQSDAPNGDGSVYLRMIESGRFNWNPNHLYFEPLSVLFWNIAQALGTAATPFGVLKFASGLSAAVSVVLFHSILVSLDVRARSLRLLLPIAMMFSAHFLSLAIAEEYFVVQMPVLLLALLFAVKWTRAAEPQSPSGTGLLVAIGA